MTDAATREESAMANPEIPAGERVFLELFEHSAQPMWIFDLETLRFLAVNEAMEQRYGYSRDELLAMTILDIRPEEEIERLQSHISRQDDGVDRAGRWFHRTRSGEILHMDITARRITYQGRRAEIVLAIDASDQVRALDRLNSAEAMYRGMVEHTMVGIYIVKDMKIAYANPGLMKIFGYNADEIIGLNILDLTVPREHAKAVEAVRERLSSEAGAGRRVFTGLRKDGSEIVVDIHNTRAGTETDPVMMGVVIDITESWNARAQAADHLAHLQRMLQDSLNAVSTLCEIRDPYTAGHSSRVGELAAAIGGELGIGAGEMDTLRKSGIVHDIGKIGVPVEILTKAAKLSVPEFGLIKNHPQLGYDILRHIDFRTPVAEIVLQHHERIDGKGYPRGLKNGEIHPLAGILAIADVVESMSSDRPYRAGLGIEVALEEIGSNLNSRYDADAGAACIRLFRERGYRIIQ
ncbi:MAG: PAS domain S-box protein [Burkholderiales bacterium]|nr:PAS domain S-box protein [Burkholderiales bacterium]